MAADGQPGAGIIMEQGGVRPQRQSHGALLMTEVQTGDHRNIQPRANELNHGFQE